MSELDEVAKEIARLKDTLNQIDVDIQKQREVVRKPIMEKLKKLEEKQAHLRKWARKIEAYECPKCYGAGILHNPVRDPVEETCRICKGKGILTREQLEDFEAGKLKSY